MYDVKKYYDVVGEFDISKYDKSINTDKRIVVLTKERKKHILERHPEVTGYIGLLGDILNFPDAVYKENNRENTFWVVKGYDKNVKVTLKISVGNSKLENSIIQMQIVRNKRLLKYCDLSYVTKLFDKMVDKKDEI